jgi:PAS domain S-box-containing protein
MDRERHAIIQKQARIRELVRQMAQVEAELTELTGGVDAVVDASVPSPILLREAQAQLQERTAELSRANEALQYQAYLLDNMTDIVVALDADRRVTAWNHAAEEIFGIAEEDALGQPVNNLLLVEFIDVPPETAREALVRHGWFEGEVWLSSRNSGRVITELKAVPLLDENHNVRGILNVHRDIRAQKQAEEERAAHERRMAILHEIDRSILASRSPDVIATEAVRHLRVAVGCDRVSVVLIDPTGQTMTVLAQDGSGVTGPLATESVIPFDLPLEMRQVLLSGQAYRVADFAAEAQLSTGQQIAIGLGYRCWVGVPMVVEGHLFGIVNLNWCQSECGAQEDIALTTQVAQSLMVALQNARLFSNLQASREQLQALSRRLVEVQEAERRAISRELHDETGQAITSLKLGLGVLQREEGLTEAAHAHIDELRRTVDAIMDGLHRLAVNLRPLSLDRYGLIPAVEQFMESFRRQTGLEVELAADGIGEDRLPDEVETVLYRAVQEGLTNIARHAQASRASVILRGQPESITLIVEDDGSGFEMGQEFGPGHLGLLGMRERAQIIGGNLTVESKPGSGTTIFVEVPRKAG